MTNRYIRIPTEQVDVNENVRFAIREIVRIDRNSIEPVDFNEFRRLPIVFIVVVVVVVVVVE